MLLLSKLSNIESTLISILISLKSKTPSVVRRY